MLKKRSRFLFPVMLMAIVVFCLGLASACRQADEPEIEDPPQEEVQVSVLMEQNAVELYQYDIEQLSVTVSGSEQAPVWESSDAAIVSVDGNGQITAVAVGNATVRATVGDAFAECRVTVTSSPYAPVIVVDNDVKVIKDMPYETSVKVTWGGQAVNETIDFAVTLAETSEEGIARASVENGILSVAGLQVGSAEFYVSATVRGQFVNKKITVSVYKYIVLFESDDARFEKSGDDYALELSTVKYANEVTEQPLAFSVLLNGETKSDAVIEWVSDSESVAKIENGKVVSVGTGEATLSGTYADPDGDEHSVSVAVSVYHKKQSKDLYDEGGKSFFIDLAVSNVDQPLASHTGSGNCEIEIGADYLEVRGVTVNGKQVEGATLSGGVLTVPASAFKASDAGKETAFEVVADTANTTDILTVHVLAATKIIKSVDDWQNALRSTKDVYGYFILGGDIDFENQPLPLPANLTEANATNDNIPYAATGFAGTFDGMGYRLKNFNTGSGANGGRYGLFVKTTNAVIKNVTFDSLTHTGATFANIFGFYLSRTTLENIRINVAQSAILSGSDMTKGSGDPYGFIGGKYVASNVYKNIEINAQGLEIFSLFGYWCSTQEPWFVCENVVVHANKVTYFGRENGNGDRVFYTTADNDLEGVTLDIPDVKFTTDNEVFTRTEDGYSVELSMAEHDGLTTETAFSFKVLLNGSEVVDARIDWTIGNSNVVKIEDGKLVAVGVGATTVKGSYTDAYGIEFTTTVSVEVTLDLPDKMQTVDKEENKSFDLNVSDVSKQLAEQTAVAQGSFDVELGSQFGTLISVTLNGRVLASATYSGSKLTLAASEFKGADAGEQTLTVKTYTNEFMYTLNVPVVFATRVICSVADFESAIRGTTSVYGHFILGNDIDFENQPLAYPAYFTSSMLAESSVKQDSYITGSQGFVGTFDGRGYAMNNFNTGGENNGGRYGLFLITRDGGSGAEIKNLVFNNLTHTGEGNANIFGFSIANVHFENVVVNVSSSVILAESSMTSGKIYGFFCGKYANHNVYKNITINAQGQNIYCLFGYWCTTEDPWFVCENVIVNAQRVDYYGRENGNGDKVFYTTADNTVAGVTLNLVAVSFETQNALFEADGAGYKVELATTTAGGGVTETELSFQVLINGVAKPNAVILWAVKETTIAEVANGKLKSVGAGTTELIGTYQDENNIEYTVKITVKVNLAIAQITKEVYADAQNRSFAVDLNVTDVAAEVSAQTVGAASYPVSLGDEYGTLMDVVYNGSKVEGATYTNGVLTLPNSLFGAQDTGEKTVTVTTYTDEAQYTLTVHLCVATKVINSVADFQSAIRSTTSVYGYFILGSDIDFADTPLSLPAYVTAYGSASEDNKVTGSTGFVGIFDGRNFRMLNFNTGGGGNGGRYGLFLKTKDGNGVVIKNIVFEDLTHTGEAFANIFGFQLAGITFENITISVKSSTIADGSVMTNGGSPYGFFCGKYADKNTFKNITIHAEGQEIYSLFGFWCKRASATDQPLTCENVVVYAKNVEYYGREDGNGDKVYYATEDTSVTGVTLILDDAT